jgi:CheY-like chemotaxis protein
LEKQDAHTATVLLVEDSEETRQVMRVSLESKGYRVLEAENGREGVETVKRERPDVILMDLHMPAMDGLAAAEEIRACRGACARTPIIAVTAYDTYGIREAALEAGCCEYLVKPLDFDSVARTISLILGA